jgi:4-hydroxythreonine-4-phosphate dehydrogenase
MATDHSSSDHALPLVLTPGEPAGVGAEIALKAWRDARAELPPFFLMEDPERLARLASDSGLGAKLCQIETPGEANAVFANALPVMPIRYPAPVRAGHPDPANGGAVIEAIRDAVSLVQAGQASAVVTNPIQKSALYQAGFTHPGHTEYLADLAGEGCVPVMMLATEALRVVPVTVHVPLDQVPGRLTLEAIVTAGRITAAALVRDFAVPAPRLAIAGLNPHAGEGGSLGRQEIDIIAPAIEALRAEGILCEGPAPADTLFHAEARSRHDAVICMYHDQALIPLKTVDFWGGVNVTLGLPFVRTSPDHGTALDLAGTGKADARSLMAALRLAAKMAARRQEAKL